MSSIGEPASSLLTLKHYCSAVLRTIATKAKPLKSGDAKLRGCLCGPPTVMLVGLPNDSLRMTLWLYQSLYRRTDALAGDAPRSSRPHITSLFAGLAMWLAALACGGDAQTKEIVAPVQQTNGSPTLPAPTAKSNILYGLYSDVSWYNDSTYRAQSIATAQSLHAQVVRVDLLWEWIEYTQGQRNWTVIDNVINQLTAAGIRPCLLVVAGTPSWANGISQAQDSRISTCTSLPIRSNSARG